MENISKLYVIVLNRSQQGYGPAGNCKVVGLTIGKTIITDEDEIKKVIPSDNKVFSGILFDAYQDGKVKDLLEISVDSISPNRAEGQNYYVTHSAVKKIGTPVVDIPSEYFVNDFIDLDLISKYLTERKLYPENYTSIYLCDNISIFGPFKVVQSTITPNIGRHTFSFEYNIEELIEDSDLDYIFLISEPKAKIKAIDCSTPSQLIDFLKDRISVDRSQLNLLTNISKKITEINNGVTELDSIRLKRASQYIDQIKLSMNDLFVVLSKEDSWNNVIGTLVDNYKEDFRKYALLGVNKEINDLENQIENRRAALSIIEENIKIKSEQIEQLNNDVRYIENKQSDLIIHLKLLAGLKDQDISKPKTISKSSFNYLSIDNVPTYDNFDNFHDNLKDEFDVKIMNKSLYEDGILLLKENDFLIAKSVEYVLNLISHLGSTKVLIQNAEPDWLKFKYWKKNGLEDFFKEANENRSKNFIYILQDFNIASFECYGKPMIDVSNKVRNKLFDFCDSIPENIKIVLIQVDEEIEDFGFPLNKSTLKSWTFLPDITSVSKVNIPSCNGIDLANFEVTRSVKDYSINYF